MAKVLVVDDDRDVRDTLREALQAAGHVVHAVEDGEAALQVLRSSTQRYVVLLDVMLPQLSGYELLGEIMREDDRAGFHAFVIVTAYPRALPPLETAYRLSALAIAAPVLAKPFDVNSLLAAVSDAERRLIHTAPLAAE